MNGESTSYYVPSSTIDTSVSSSGGAFSFGYTGISLGGSSTNSSTNIAYSQRVIAIPAKSYRLLDAMPLYYDIVKQTQIRNIQGLVPDAFHGYFYGNTIHFPKDKKLKDNDCCIYSPDNSPINLSFILRYSFTEDCAATKTISSDFFLKQVVAFNYKSKRFFNTSGNKSVLFYDFVGLGFYKAGPYFPLGEVRSLNDTESSSKTK